MNICFIGLGSIAERHIKNLKDMLEDNVSIDVLRSGKGKSGFISRGLPHRLRKVQRNY